MRRFATTCLTRASRREPGRNPVLVPLGSFRTFRTFYRATCIPPCLAEPDVGDAGGLRARDRRQERPFAWTRRRRHRSCYLTDGSAVRALIALWRTPVLVLRERASEDGLGCPQADEEKHARTARRDRAGVRRTDGSGEGSPPPSYERGCAMRAGRTIDAPPIRAAGMEAVHAARWGRSSRAGVERPRRDRSGQKRRKRPWRGCRSCCPRRGRRRGSTTTRAWPRRSESVSLALRLRSGGLPSPHDPGENDAAWQKSRLGFRTCRKGVRFNPA
jgi:hypothetical protein